MNCGKYYLGIDAGTSSVGWAVTDSEYHIIKKNGKALWGSRLFDEASTAEKRRMARGARRRGDRRAFRQALLRELFQGEISKVDPAFYLRLDESKFWEDDKKVPTKYCLFADGTFNDRDYHKAYPTIYHLRDELMHSDAPHDVRLVYLALAHLIKHRGHFFSQMSVTDAVPDFAIAWNVFQEDALDLMGLQVSCKDQDALRRVLQEKLPVREKQQQLKALIQVSGEAEQPAFTCVYDLLSGKTCDVSKSFGIHLEGEEKNALKLSLTGEDLDDDEKLAGYQTYLEDRLQLLFDLQEVYNWGVLVNILHGASSVSEAKKISYDKHAEDLDRLQSLIKEEFPEQYNLIFRYMREKLDNYCAYTGHFDKRNPKYAKAAHSCTQEDFYKFVRKKIEPSVSDAAQQIRQEMELGTFLPLQRSKENSVIPYQMNLREMKMILDHASGYLPFLLETDEEGISVRDKVESLLTFRVPYYVGPLDNTNAKVGTHWAIKKQPDKRVLPWNFERVVDKEACAQAFMEQLTNTCTYLIGEPVLPKDSLTYSHFMALNELNNVTVYGERLPVSVKQKIFRELFQKRPTVTTKTLVTFLVKEGLIKKGEADAVGGFDGDFKASLKTEQRLNNVFAEQMPSAKQMDDMILAVLLLKQEPEMLRSRIRRIVPGITEAQLKAVCRLPCNGWGRLSDRFLTGLRAVLPGGTEEKSILEALWETQYNLMQLLASHMPYAKLIQEYNQEMFEGSSLNYESVEKLSAPPAVRRTIWQTLKIIREVQHIMGGAPEKIFVEMAKGPVGSGRTVSRKNQLNACYAAMGEMGADWIQALEGYEEPRLRQDKLYLYFTQMGRCMYSGEPIVLSDLLNDTGNQIYDIDHIYPRSKVKDDSLDNRVLVLKKANMEKSDNYPIRGEIRSRQFGFWKNLRDHQLISATKFERLIRATGFSEEELASFINRQLVETRQSTKLLAQLLGQALPESRIVYVKAGNVSDFRQMFDLVKIRDLNDLHHAKDAYLNIVVGNVYDVKFTANPGNFIRSRERYSMKPETLYAHSVQRDGTIAWNEKSIEVVKRSYRRNNIMITRMALRRNSGQNGGFYDQNPVSGGSIPLKGDPRLANTERYGGYNGDTGAYMMLVEHGVGKKRGCSLEPVYLRYAGRIEKDKSYLQFYCREVLHLEEPKILVPEIKFNTLLEIKGFRFWITGRSGTAQVVGIQEFQLVLSPDQENYMKRVLKTCERLKQTRGNLEITEEHDRITAAENLTMYDVLMQKMQINAYRKRPSSQVLTLQNGREKFVGLSLSDQCSVLYNILQLFRGGGKADLTGIGGSKSAGTILFSRKVGDEMKMIYQSVTGFYSREEQLRK